MKNIDKIIHPMSQALIYESLHLGNNSEQLLASMPYKLDTELFACIWKPFLQKHASRDHKAKLSCHISFEVEDSLFFISDELDKYTNRNQQVNHILNIGKICIPVTNTSTPAHTSTTKGLNCALSFN